MTIKHIERWHKVARPEPTERDFGTQLGCHIEEFAEMIADLKFHHPEFGVTFGTATGAYNTLVAMANMLKRGETTATIKDRENFLKELCDQVVTATGVAYCAGMNMPEALEVVDRSNFSKFGPDGKPVRDENGKIMKSEHYSKPYLQGLY